MKRKFLKCLQNPHASPRHRVLFYKFLIFKEFLSYSVARIVLDSKNSNHCKSKPYELANHCIRKISPSFVKHY